MKTVSIRPKKTPTSGLRRILVPTDFSRAASEALCYAVPLARQIGGEISLLHVLDWPVVPAALGAAMTDEAKLTGAAKQALDELARTTVPPALLEKTLVRVGRAYQNISESARGLRMDLIVIATQGRTGLKRALLGSTAERVVRHATCPVLTVRSVAGAKSPGLKSKSLAPRINRILVPVDFSPRSKAAVRYAADLARTMRARLGLLHVVAPLPLNATRHRAEIRQYDAEMKIEARRQLAALAAIVPKGIKAEALLEQGVPQQSILAAAREWRSDLIVLPTRGLTGVKYIVLGSTAEAVVRHAHCPVLTLGRACLKN
jgi:nucleotide-binding universal stress UspA family protein